MAVLCDATIVDCYVHVADEVIQSVIVCMDGGERDHYLFLHAAFAKCETCLTFWLHHGADLSRGTASYPDWIALEWARASNASPEILRLLTPSVWPSLRPHAFCAGVELDMYVHCPVGLTGDVSASWPCGREIISSFCAQQEIFAKFACELGAEVGLQVSSVLFRYVRAMMEMKLQECSRSLLPAGRSCGVVLRRHL